MKLNQDNLKKITDSLNQKSVEINSYPIKVIQFGTGVLLRGLIDYYIDQANQNSDFGGSILVIKSTSQGDSSAFDKQNNLYTIQTQGIKDGQVIKKQQIITCISQMLTAQQHWTNILKIAEQPTVEFIISNTTESGIVETDESIQNTIPTSFPGKLTAILYHRFQYFKGAQDKGLVILPTELIDHNADKLKTIVLNLASKNNLPDSFIHWLNESNHFCNTLVDRIVPGAISSENLGYEDELAIAVEPFNLWAIEAKEDSIKEKITFAKSNLGIKIIPDIDITKELKLRLLNATHSLLCPIAILGKHEFVRSTMDNQEYQSWTNELMQVEIKQHLILQNIPEEDIDNFSSTIVDRFKNPFIDHKWLSIAQNSTAKWQQRILPILKSWESSNQPPSQKIAFSLACYLKCNQIFTKEDFPLDINIKENLEAGKTPLEILKNEEIWGEDLTKYSAFIALTILFFEKLESSKIDQQN